MKKITLILLCLILLSGCASSIVHMAEMETPPVLDIPSDNATLVLIGETFTIGTMPGYKTYLDQKVIGAVRSGSYFLTSVEPGKHYVITEKNGYTCVTPFNFEPGKAYFIGQSTVPFFNKAILGMDYRPSGLYPISLEDANKVMKRYSFMEYEPDPKQKDMDPQFYQQAISEYLKYAKENPDAYKEILGYEGVIIR